MTCRPHHRKDFTNPPRGRHEPRLRLLRHPSRCSRGRPCHRPAVCEVAKVVNQYQGPWRVDWDPACAHHVGRLIARHVHRHMPTDERPPLANLLTDTDRLLPPFLLPDPDPRGPTVTTVTITINPDNSPTGFSPGKTLADALHHLAFDVAALLHDPVTVLDGLPVQERETGRTIGSIEVTK